MKRRKEPKSLLLFFFFYSDASLQSDVKRADKSYIYDERRELKLIYSEEKRVTQGASHRRSIYTHIRERKKKKDRDVKKKPSILPPVILPQSARDTTSPYIYIYRYCIPFRVGRAKDDDDVGGAA